MIIIYKSNPEVKRILDMMLESGSFRDYSEIISLAIMNFAVLQEELGGEIALQGEGDEREFPRADRGVLTRMAGFSFGVDDVPVRGSLGKKQRELVQPIPETSPIDLPQAPVRESTSRDVTVDEWLFGQYNRLLPAKVSCRAIANLVLKGGGGIRLVTFSPQIAQMAFDLGKPLKELDERYGHTRDKALSTAFPSNGNKKHKSLERFMSQFIGQTNSDGRLTGLLADLRFVQMLEETEDRIILTEQGWRFAALSNPVLDGSFGDHRDGLSGDEVSYLIHHIVDFVPEERSAYKTLLKHIREGSDTPRKLDLHLKSSLSRQKKGDLSDSFLSSQRSAAISRMVELGLVKREREGVYVRYLSTESGNHLLNRLMTESGQP